MTRNLSQLFAAEPRPVWVFDGGIGTLLQHRGLKVGECPEELNVSHPEILLEIHREYVAAGSDIIQTNTFGGNTRRLSNYGLESKTVAINTRAVELARQAAGDKAYVAASVGPTGEILEPYGNVSREAVFEAFQTQARGLGEADLVNIETMNCLDEALLAFEAIRSVLGLPICVSVTFNQAPTGYFTIMGESVERITRALTEAGVNMLGSNCGEGVEQMLAIISEMHRLTSLPLMAKPNAGLPQLTGGREVFPETPESFAQKMRAVMAAGATLCGGCCGTTPDHIRVIRQLADELNASP
ncbi:MAG: homocysteine S-methyltransferase family protein [Candidatus Neomarinimicrobiota bacterium]